MKILIVLSAFVYVTTSFGQNVWIAKDAVNGPPRGAAASFSLNDEAFVVGGVNLEEFKRKMYSYDLEQNDWDDEIALGGDIGEGLERGSAVGFSAAGYGYVALGAGASSTMKDLWRYNPEDESWTQMADFAGTARRGAVAFAVDDLAYVGTGQDADGLKDDFYKYDPATNAWTELTDFDGGARKEAVGFTMGGKGYLGTGRGESGYFSDFWEYNPLTDVWTEKAEFPGTPRFGAVGCGVFPSAFIMLGEDNDFEYKDDVWEYNYFGDVWTQRADYPGGTRTQANAITVGSRIFVGLGYDGVYHDDFYEYEQILSVEEAADLVQLKLYPNPAHSIFTITTSKALENPTIQIFDVKGREISNQFLLNQTNSNQIELQINSFISNGNYFVSLYDRNEFIGSTKVTIN